MKKNRIRIHQKTLEVLKNPKYVYLLINPKNSGIALCACSGTDRDAIRLKQGTDRDCEIYSTELMDEIMRIGNRLDSHGSYRLLGQQKDDGRMVVFRMDDAIIID